MGDVEDEFSLKLFTGLLSTAVTQAFWIRVAIRRVFAKLHTDDSVVSSSLAQFYTK